MCISHFYWCPILYCCQQPKPARPCLGQWISPSSWSIVSWMAQSRICDIIWNWKLLIKIQPKPKWNQQASHEEKEPLSKELETGTWRHDNKWESWQCTPSNAHVVALYVRCIGMHYYATSSWSSVSSQSKASKHCQGVQALVLWRFQCYNYLIGKLRKLLHRASQSHRA